MCSGETFHTKNAITNVHEDIFVFKNQEKNNKYSKIVQILCHKCQNILLLHSVLIQARKAKRFSGMRSSFSAMMAQLSCLQCLFVVFDEMLYRPALTAALLNNKFVVAVDAHRNLQTSLRFSVLDRSVLGVKQNNNKAHFLKPIVFVQIIIIIPLWRNFH